MAEYKGSGGSIQIDGEDLVLTQTGPGSRLMKTRVPRRIPIAAVREVLFKKPGMNNGYIHLVLGDTPPPENTGFSSMTSHPETVVFRPGKQAKAFHELRDMLLARIEHNRARGLDPASISVLTPQENTDADARRLFANVESEMFDGNMISRSDLGDDATNEDMIVELRAKPEFAALQSWDTLLVSLRPHEQIELLAVGSAILALTNLRVVAVRDELGRSRHDEIPRDQLTSASWDSRVRRGGLTFHSAAQQFVVAGLGRSMAERFIAAIATINPAPAAAPHASGPDPMEQLRKLGELRDAGVLTEDEFAAKKVQLLDRL